MPDENSEKLENDAPPVSTDIEKSEMRKGIEKIQKNIKNRWGPLPVDFAEKAFMDEGWEC